MAMSSFGVARKVRQMATETVPDHTQVLPADHAAGMDSFAIEESRSRRAVPVERDSDVDEPRLWSDVFHQAAFGIGVGDPASGTLRFSNEALAAMHGMRIDEMQSRQWLDLYAPAEQGRVAKLMAEADRAGHVDFEADRVRKDGSIFPARMHITSVKGANGEVRRRIATTQDITPEREHMSELEQSRRLEAVAQLTAGIAHDFNNLLQGVMANLELVDDEIAVAPAVRANVASAVRLAEQGGQLAHNLLAFARKQLLSPSEVDLGEFLKRFESLLGRTLDPSIRIDVTCEPGLAPVWIDARYLQTALLHLAINARDAMPAGGTLKIAALGTGSARLVHTSHGRRCVVVRVSDSGTGIPPQNMANLCEPFFSTKGVNGSGLGLSMVHGFVKQSGGDLLITSEAGKGTCVEIRLPQAPMPLDATPATGQQ
jgi:PAS domain S-box-containing protein